MRSKQVGNKADQLYIVVKNGDSSVIPLGTPVALALSGTEDGLQVVLPATATATNVSTFAAGVLVTTTPGSTGLTLSGYGEAQIYGICQSARLLRTRATSTDSFVSLAQGLLLLAETVSNCFATAASNGATAFLPSAALAASVAAIASTAASTGTGATQMCKAFLRMA